MTTSLCERIKPSGQRCGSPALSGLSLCYYHAQQEMALPGDRNLYTAHNPDAKPGEWAALSFPTPALEDAAAIQIGFMQALHGVAIDALNPRKAKLMLSALHGARMNLAQLENCLQACVKGASANRKKKPPASVKETAVRLTQKARG